MQVVCPTHLCASRIDVLCLYIIGQVRFPDDDDDEIAYFTVR